MQEPIAVDQLADEFERLRTERDETPTGLAAWEAFVALAERPAQAGNAAAGITEDLLMLEVITDEGDAPQVRLVRIVGLRDAEGGYVDSRMLECVLFYDRAQHSSAIESGSITGWLYPDLSRADLGGFIDRVTARPVYRLLIAHQEPVEIGVSPM